MQCFDQMGGLVSPALDLLELCQSMSAAPQSYHELPAGDRYVKVNGFLTTSEMSRYLNALDTMPASMWLSQDEIGRNKIRYQKGRWIHDDGTPYDRAKFVRSLPENERYLSNRCGRAMLVQLE